MMKRTGIDKGLFLLGILLIIISAISLVFGYRIREQWPATVSMCEMGIPSLIGMAGVTFFSVSVVLFFILNLRKNIRE
jgi:hypothetical protein